MKGASVHERVLRGVGKTALGGTVTTPPLWIFSPIPALAIVALVVSAVALVVFGLWYALWALEGSGAKSPWNRAEYLGAGGIWMVPALLGLRPPLPATHPDPATAPA